MTAPIQSEQALSDATALPAFAEAAAPTGQVVLVHQGARDGYQLAMALAEAGLLHALVTDLFWSNDRAWSRYLERALPPRWRAKLSLRSGAGVPSRQVRTNALAGLGGLAMDRLRRLPFAWRRRWARSADAALGKAAGRLARRSGLGLVSYSYFGYDAFRAYGRGGLLFQVHPHPTTMRHLLRDELVRNPECASSLETEWELALPEQDFQHLVEETAMASRYMVASSFTRRTLIENGAQPAAIRVIPYGVDLERFSPGKRGPRKRELHLLFVGRINQRKGLKYLLQAMRLLKGRAVHLLICGRPVDDLPLLKEASAQIEVRPFVSAEALVAAYRQADLFVFPSVAEGFGQVLLEAMACGAPILSTTSTAAPDLIEDGVQGFIVEPARPDQLAARILWAMDHRDELAAMGRAARERAETFTWERFRAEAAETVKEYLAADAITQTGGRA